MKKAWFILLLVICLFFDSKVLAAAVNITDYYNEVLKFDEEGNLLMTVYDGIASYNTTYRTIGWMIKRYDLPIDDPQNICISIPLDSAGSMTDPENSGYVYSYFYCDRDIIFTRIGEESEEWQKELYRNGAVVYLDGIMTVCENGIAQGTLLEEGRTSIGEVYNTYEGILGARGWGPISQESLKTHFNKCVWFPAVSELLPSEEEDESRSLEYQYFHYKEEGLDTEGKAMLSSYEFDVEDAIPTSERLYAEAYMTPYGYKAGYACISGSRTYEVPIVIYYQEETEDEKGNIIIEDRVATDSCPVIREYTYWTLEEMKLYYASGMKITNGTLEGGSIMLETGYQTNVEIDAAAGEEAHMKEPAVYTVTIDAGFSGPGGDYSAEAEASVGEILVRSDRVFIDGQVILEDDWREKIAASPALPSESEEIKLYRENMKIPSYKKNDRYASYASAQYRLFSWGASGNPVVTKPVAGVNPVEVHTPVYCRGIISDDKWLNQMEYPREEHASLILGESFYVDLGTEGEHRKSKGYGERDYRRYAYRIQVKIPFAVRLDGAEIAAGTWVDIEGKTEFFLPVGTAEGEYIVDYRTVAENVDAGYKGWKRAEKKANLQSENYIAEDSVAVMVMGRVFDFTVSDVHDYPRWEGIFKGVSFAGLTEGYRVGCNTCNGDSTDLPQIFTLPVMSGSNPLRPDCGALKTGYHFKYSLTTIGDFYYPETNIYIETNFYFIDKKTGERIPADIYYCLTEDGKYQNLKRQPGQVILNAFSRTLDKQERSLQNWTGDYYIPQKVYAVRAGTALPPYGINSLSWLHGGYLAVNFNIWVRNGEKKYLSYLNQKNEDRGYCNMWCLEGFLGVKTDYEGVSHQLMEGDVLFYDLDRSLAGDFSIFGTH